MKTKITAAILFLLFLSACNSSVETTTVKIHFQNQNNNVSKKTINHRDVNEGVPPINAKDIIISVYAGEYAAGNLIIQQAYSNDLSVAEMEISSGADRIFVVEATDVNGIYTYRGESIRVDLVADETANVSIKMEPLDIPTATVNISLYYSDGLTVFEPATANNLLNDRVVLSVITMNSTIFEVPIEEINEVEVACTVRGDYGSYDSVTTYTSSVISGITVPANAFVLIVAKGYFDDIGGPAESSEDWIRYIGAADPANTNDLDEGSVVSVEIHLQDGVAAGSESDAAAWDDYCKCAP